MSYWESRGVLTINDPCGRYVGLQSVARSFLTRQNIDISFLGPKERPTAIVLKLTYHPASKEAEERAIKRNAELRARNPKDLRIHTEKEIREMYSERRKFAMQMKADYFANATPELFSTLLSQATSTFGADKLSKTYGSYHIYYNNCLTDDCTEEEFYNGDADFT